MALSTYISTGCIIPTALEQYDVNNPEKAYKYLQQFFNCITYCQSQWTIIILPINNRRPYRQYGCAENTMNLSVHFCIDWISQFWNRWENPEHIPALLQKYYNNTNNTDIISLLIKHLLYKKDFDFKVEYPILP
jgi:hypothetical protein